MATPAVTLGDIAARVTRAAGAPALPAELAVPATLRVGGSELELRPGLAALAAAFKLGRTGAPPGLGPQGASPRSVGPRDIMLNAVWACLPPEAGFSSPEALGAELGRSPEGLAQLARAFLALQAAESAPAAKAPTPIS